MRSVAMLVIVVVAASGCGRFGFDDQVRVSGDMVEVDARTDDALVEPDAPPDVASDAPPDLAVVPMCAVGTTLTSSGSGVCIELDQRAALGWLDAKTTCIGEGRRLCADAEWLDGCSNAVGILAMTNDWEWVAEESAGIAQKRGGDGACTDMSAHGIDTPYTYRCCVDLP